MLAGALGPADSPSRFLLAFLRSFFSFLDLSRNENVGFRALILGGVSCNVGGGGDEGGVIVLEPMSSSCDSAEKMVLFFREGEEDKAATLVSRMARSRLSSASSVAVFSLLVTEENNGAFQASLRRWRFGGR